MPGCTLPIVVLLEGGVVGVIAAIYQVSPHNGITAAPMFANLSSFAWNRIAGRARPTGCFIPDCDLIVRACRRSGANK